MITHFIRRKNTKIPLHMAKHRRRKLHTTRLYPSETNKETGQHKQGLEELQT